MLPGSQPRREGSDLGANSSGQVSFERTEALAFWELAPVPSGLAYPLVPTPGGVRGTRRASRGGSTRACVPATHPQVVAPGPSSSGKLGQRQCLRQGVQPPKEIFLAEGARQIRSNEALTGAHCAAADGAFGNLRS